MGSSYRWLSVNESAWLGQFPQPLTFPPYRCNLIYRSSACWVASFYISPSCKVEKIMDNLNVLKSALRF